MTNIIVYSYYYRYKQARNTVKNLVTSDDFINATSLLNDFITEHDNYINSNNINIDNNNFTAIDNRSLHHAMDHLQVANTSQSQKDSTINALDED